MIEKFTMMALMLNVGPRAKDERGATATEYGLLIALIAFVILGGVLIFGNALTAFFTSIGTTVQGWATNGLT